MTLEQWLETLKFRPVPAFIEECAAIYPDLIQSSEEWGEQYNDWFFS